MASTRFLEALLTVALVCAVGFWIFMPRTALLPRSPRTIASVLALLADGNIFDCLPRHAAWTSDEQLEMLLTDLGIRRVWMGWKRLSGQKNDERRRFMICGI